MKQLLLTKVFAIDGDIKEILPFGNGHINDTYRLINESAEKPDYLLQRVNHHVFKNIPAMMNNIELVTSHIRKKLLFSPGSVNGMVATLIHTREGCLFHKEEGEYWRVFKFMKDFKSYDKPNTPEQMYEGAKSFGEFLYALSDFPIEELHYTLPNFHNMEFRFKQFFAARDEAENYRLEQAKNEIKYVQDTADYVIGIYNMSKGGRMPLRVTHNDTKFNNVLLDGNDKGQCVIDLDTVMPGYVYFDVGDGIRTGASTADEHELDLQKVDVDLIMVEAFVRGYMDASSKLFTDDEMAILPKSGIYMSFIMGLRFLTDYLQGDKYYKIDFPEQNLQRARCQLHLSKLMRKRLPEIKEVFE
ncbi:aminoglycoside phosphotransferase family protein [Fulvivirgaceae bacterium BMA12]|uniref:Aminoglycoside phosphotransferase family protein n=1 Tax=Agaribacillus aureus TaxID=3051825 RepID=A0ABT8LBA2_9BACT|nr:aminoglycoside phosphotransferase family protein [Fulvivirgaceae bacterium BMA12]